MTRIGIIGGTGLKDLPLIDPVGGGIAFGIKKVAFTTGKFTEDGPDIVYLHRHHGAVTPPHKIDHKAHIGALSKLGVTHIIATSAVGTLKAGIFPVETFAIPDDLIDATDTHLTFVEDGAIKHLVTHPPYDEDLRRILAKARARTFYADPRPHMGSPTRNCTLLSIRGPRFNSRAESKMWQQLGASLVNMTTAPEAVLAKECGIPYAVICFVTDKDFCYPDSDTEYNVILGRFEKAREEFNKLIPKAVELIADLEAQPAAG